MRGVRRVAGELQGSQMDHGRAWQSIKRERNPLDPFSLMKINTQMQGTARASEVPKQTQ